MVLIRYSLRNIVFWRITFMIDEVDLMLYARQEAQLNTSIDTGLDN
jgi:hypothetical protein